MPALLTLLLRSIASLMVAVSMLTATYALPAADGIHKSAYVGNAKSHIFHEASCESSSKMKEAHKVTLETRDEAIELGYAPCGICKP